MTKVCKRAIVFCLIFPR